MERGFPFNERELLSIHNLILRGIIPEDAGSYRRVQVMITGSQHMPPQPYLIPKEMEDYLFGMKVKKQITSINFSCRNARKVSQYSSFY
jgi:Fic family protein